MWRPHSTGGDGDNDHNDDDGDEEEEDAEPQSPGPGWRETKRSRKEDSYCILQSHSFIQSLKRYLLGISYVPGSVPGVWDTTVNKTKC